MKPDFLIFDCDGVLVDSEWLVARIEVETRAEFGQQITIEEYIRRYVGLSTRSPEYLESLKGMPPEFRDIMKERVERAFHEELEAIPGIAEVLEHLKHRPKAIASSSSPHEIEMMLVHVGFKGNIFSVSMVARPKPAPDVYLHAAEQNNVLPSQCLVIEDSVVGATAALTAGMTVWGFVGGRHSAPNTADRLRTLGVARVIEHMDEIRNYCSGADPPADKKPRQMSGLLFTNQFEAPKRPRLLFAGVSSALGPAQGLHPGFVG
ncbi:MAG: HAD family phosphatase [bacterium]|nr:HAD family phosphatase [bacterium]